MVKKSISIDVKWFDGKLQEEVINAAMKGATQWAEVVKGEAQKEAPVMTGTLMRSALVEPKKQEVEISFNTPYARKMHEEHSSKAKYLERPFQRLFPHAVEFIENQLRKL